MSENDIIEVAPVAKIDRYAENMRAFRQLDRCRCNYGKKRKWSKKIIEWRQS